MPDVRREARVSDEAQGGERWPEALDVSAAAGDWVRELVAKLKALRAENALLRQQVGNVEHIAKKYVAEKDFRTWLIEKRPEEFTLPIPLLSSDYWKDESKDSVRIVDRVSYRLNQRSTVMISRDEFDHSRVNRAEMLAMIDPNDHRTIEPMFAQYLEDQRTIRRLTMEL